MILSTQACSLPRLPLPSMRYTPVRKKRIVEAVRSGIVVRKDVIDTYGLSEPEFCEWEDKFPLSDTREAA